MRSVGGRSRVMWIRRAGSALLAAVALAVVAAPAGGDEPAPDDETFFESVEVRVTNVEVVVTDRDGRPVRGLGRDDFELLEDGRRVAITHFSGPPKETEPPAAEAAREGATADAVSPPSPPSPSPPPAATGAGLEIALFIDELSLPHFARQRLGRSLEQFLGARPTGPARVLIGSFDGRLHLREVDVADTEAVRAALDEIAARLARPRRVGESEIARRRVLEEIARASLPPRADEAARPDSSALEASSVQAAIRLFAETEHDKNRRTLAALGETVDALSGWPGRRALVWLGGGLAARPAEVLVEAYRQKYQGTPYEDFASAGEAFENDATTLVEATAAHANSRRVTIYGLGLGTDLAEAAGSAEVGGDGPLLRDLGRSAAFDFNQGPEIAAAATGGFSLAGGADPARFLDRVGGDLDVAYSLGYEPSRRASGKLHALEVRMRDRKLRVRHRKASRDETTDERMKERTATALRLDAGGPLDAEREGGNPLAAALSFEGARRLDDGKVEVTLMVKVPMARLALLPQETAHEGRLRIYVAARDQAGRMSDVVIVAAPVRVPNDILLTALGQTVACPVRLVLRAGPHRIAAGVWDDVGKSESLVLADLPATRADGA